jgi:hypothetical protein
MPAATPTPAPSLLAQHSPGSPFHTSPFGHPLVGPPPWHVQEALRTGPGAPAGARPRTLPRWPARRAPTRRRALRAGDAGEGRMLKLMASGGLAGAGAPRRARRAAPAWGCGRARPR